MRALRHLPNLISALRIALVAPIAWSLWHLQLRSALALVALAGASDLCDGFLAKRFGWQSKLGALLDPAADKLLLVTLFVLLALMGALPGWLAATVIGREAVLVAGAAAYRLLLGPVEIRPSIVSKLNTALEVLYILLVIAHLAYGSPGGSVLVTAGALTFVTVVVSGLDYVLRYARLALQASGEAARGAGALGQKRP